MSMYIKPYRSRRYQINRSQKSIDRDVHIPLNVKFVDDTYVVEMIVPGLSPDDVEIEIVKNKIDVQGEFNRAEQDVKYLRQEIPSGSFRRVIKLSKMVDVEGSEAKLEDGILSLRVPVAEESLPRTIKVNTN